MGRQCKGNDASQVPFFVTFFVLDRNVPMDWTIHVIASTGSFQTSKTGSFYVHCAWSSVVVLVCIWGQLSRRLYIPNRTFLVRFGGTSGEFGRAMVRILARRSRAKIPMARFTVPNAHGEIYRTQYPWVFTVPKFSPKFSVTVAESGQWLDIVGYQDSRVGFWLANCEFG